MSKAIETQVDHAIFTSITEDRIVHLPWSAEAEELLRAQCDDEAESAEVVEFWGTSESDDPSATKANDWRVHLDRA